MLVMIGAAVCMALFLAVDVADAWVTAVRHGIAVAIAVIVALAVAIRILVTVVVPWLMRWRTSRVVNGVQASRASTS